MSRSIPPGEADARHDPLVHGRSGGIRCRRAHIVEPASTVCTSQSGILRATIAAAASSPAAVEPCSRRLYCELIAATRATLAALQETGKRVADLAGIAAERWRAQLCHYLPLIERILTQTQRRVLDGQTVKAGEKLVSLFEPHADIIVKAVGWAADVAYKLFPAKM